VPGLDITDDDRRLDAVVVGAPVDDAGFDGLGLEVLGEGFVDEVGNFGVGGEAEGDELTGGELVDVGAVGGWEERGEAEALFEADDAVLHLHGAFARDAGHDEEYDGHDDPPDMFVAVGGPSVDGDVDGEDEIEGEEGDDEEVKGGVEAGVVLDVLRGRHCVPPKDVWRASA
jgi:hypothetical protein